MSENVVWGIEHYAEKRKQAKERHMTMINSRRPCSQINLVGVYGTLPETLTLFQTKIWDFPYPISDLTFKSIRDFRPAL